MDNLISISQPYLPCVSSSRQWNEDIALAVRKRTALASGLLCNLNHGAAL